MKRTEINLTLFSNNSVRHKINIVNTISQLIVLVISTIGLIMLYNQNKN